VRNRFPSFVLSLCTSVAAQSTWIVNPGGGPGVHFTDLPSAVAAASDGDTILVQWGPFLAGVGGFTTNKGLTIVSEGQVSLATLTTPVTVSGLPTGRQFRLVGFDAPLDQEMRIVLQNCAGEVHLENLHAVEPGWFAPGGPSIDVANCALVTLRDVEDFGNPAVQIANSRVVLANCRLGITTLGLAGGPCLHATDSVVDVSEPFFQTGFSPVCITLLRTHLRIGGTAGSRIAAGDPQFSVPGTPIVATLGSVTVDPAVPLLASPVTSPAITGTAVVQTTYVPATWSGRARPGQTVTIEATHPANSVLMQFVGFPGPATATPYGTTLLALTPSPVFLLTVAFHSNAGVTATPIAIPAWLSPGIGFAAQTLVLHTTAELGTAVQFVVH